MKFLLKPDGSVCISFHAKLVHPTSPIYVNPHLVTNLNVHRAFTECGPWRHGHLHSRQHLRPRLCGGGEDPAWQAIPLQPRLLRTGARIRTERVGGTSQGEKDYMAGMKSGPQVAKIFRES